MHTSSAACHFGSNHGLASPQTKPDGLSQISGPSPVVYAPGAGTAVSVFDQIMKEAGSHRPPVATSPYFVVGRVSREAVDMLIDGLAILGRRLVGTIAAFDRGWQIGPSSVQAAETARCDANGSPADPRTMDWQLDALTPKAFWTYVNAKGLNGRWFDGRMIVLIEATENSREALHLARQLRSAMKNSNVFERYEWRSEIAEEKRPAPGSLSGNTPGAVHASVLESNAEVREYDQQVSRLQQALRKGIETVGSVAYRWPAWEAELQALPSHSVRNLMDVFEKMIRDVKTGAFGLLQSDVERMYASRRDIVREAEKLARIRERPIDFAVSCWEFLASRKVARANNNVTDILVLEPEAGRSFVAFNPDKEAVSIRLAGAAQSRHVVRVPQLGTYGISNRGLHWKLETLSPDAFWACASARGLDREWFNGKQIVFIEPDIDSGEAMKMASMLRWKESDPILVMKDARMLVDGNGDGYEVCKSQEGLASKECIGIADPAKSQKRSLQLLRLIDALKKGIGALADVLPQNEAWMQGRKAVDEYSVNALAALFGRQIEAVNQILQTDTIRREDADLLLEARSDVVREAKALGRLDYNNLHYAWKQLSQRWQSRKGTSTTEFVILEPTVGRHFIVDNRVDDVVIVTLRGVQKDQPDYAGTPPFEITVPVFANMRII